MKYDSLKDLYKSLFSNKESDSKVLNEKEDFLAMLTHDLKTPIRAQIRALELLLNDYFGPLNPKQREIIEEILASNKYMQNLTENILTNYKTENGKLVIKKSKNDIKLTVENTVRNLKYILIQKNQTANIQYKNIQNTVYSYDDIEIQRVLTNLIVNASEYSYDNSTIDIIIEKCRGCLKITVSDTGPVISKNNIDSLFDKYSTNSKDYRKAGTGLGLYICKIIITAHGGKIEAKRLQNNITSFSFTINDD